jgi:predicted secreted protein
MKLPEPSETMDVEGKAGEPITLPIASGPATGYAWRLDLPEGVARIEDGPPRTVQPAERLGGATGGYLRVTAPAGEHLVVARLARPWEPDRPARVVSIRLHVV